MYPWLMKKDQEKLWNTLKIQLKTQLIKIFVKPAKQNLIGNVEHWIHNVEIIKHLKSIT
jgi:hypothetical protein